MGNQQITQKQEYDALVAELRAIEKANGGIYLTDECVDAENAVVPLNHPEFWQRCYISACSAAGSRAEELGLDINALMGRVIY